MRIVFGVLMRVGVLVLGLGIAVEAQTPQADPAKSAQKPWTLDPRCAVMAARVPGNQGVLTSACVAQEAGRVYLNQAPGYHPSQTQTQQSHSDKRPRPPRED